jgi:hypothetical protein
MRRIFTLFIAFFLIASAQNVFAQTCTTVATSGVPADYLATAENQTITNGTTGVFNSPISYFPSTPPTAIKFYLKLQQTGNGNPGTTLKPTVTIKWGTGGSVSSTCTSIPSFSVTSTATNYYFSITPSVPLPANTNFQITVSLQNTGNRPALISAYGIDKTAISPAGAILPVHFSNFDAKASEGGVALTWKVGIEENVTAYEVEKSNNGRDFSTIGNVAAAGKSSYSYNDRTPVVAAFYRIKSVDADGKFAYSTVASFKGGRSSIVLKAFPMPVQKDLTVQHGTANSNSKINVSAEDGRIIKTIIPSVGSQQTEVDFSTLRAGLYLIRFDNGNGESGTLKVIKQ